MLIFAFRKKLGLWECIVLIFTYVQFHSDQQSSFLYLHAYLCEPLCIHKYIFNFISSLCILFITNPLVTHIYALLKAMHLKSFSCKLHMITVFVIFAIVLSTREEILVHNKNLLNCRWWLDQYCIRASSLLSSFFCITHMYITVCYWITCMYVKIVQALINVLCIWFVMLSYFVRNVQFSLTSP